MANSTLSRSPSHLLAPTPSTPIYTIDAKDKSYRHQYSNIYFTRLAMLRGAVEERAKNKWKDVDGSPLFVERVLDVVKSQLCWIIGTVYIDMPLKPNVLEDLSRNHSIPAPNPREKFYSSNDSVMIEDSSGRIKLVGAAVTKSRLVTGVIVAALGMETDKGDFEVVDLCFADLAPFAEEAPSNDETMDVDDSSQPDEYVAAISGLSFGSPVSADSQIQMLVEFLSGEAGEPEDQELASSISRLVVAGNSLIRLTESEDDDEEELKPKRRYGAPAEATFTPHPNHLLSEHLADLTTFLPVHILPGPDDPSGSILPQQPFPRAMFGEAAGFDTFRCETNPVWLRVGSGLDPPEHDDDEPSTSKVAGNTVRSFLVSSGQPILDMYKYLPTPPSTLVTMAASTLKWRHMAPTAPDTLWCHPFREKDPFVLRQTPDVYIIGNMPQFGTTLVYAGDKTEGRTTEDRPCRVVLVPSFLETGVLVLVNLRSLAVRCVQFGGPDMRSSKPKIKPEEEDIEQAITSNE